MTKSELERLAVELDYESGFPELTAAQSWDAELHLGKRNYALHTAANHLFFAASLMEAHDHTGASSLSR